MTAAPDAAPRRSWRRLGDPEAFAHGREAATVVAACTLVLTLIGVLDAALAPTVPLGTPLLLVVLAAAWTLSNAASALVTLEAIAVPITAAAFGGDTAVAAQVKVAAIAVTALTVRVAVRELKASQRALRRRGDEVAAALRRMETANAALERFTGDAAHELRTPLALIQSEIDVALGGGRAGAATRRHLERIAADVGRLRDIIDCLLVLAQADAGALDLSTTARDIDVVDFFEAALSRWADLAEAQGGRLVRRLPDEGLMRGDPDLLARVVDNLVGNALRHGGAGVAVEVDVTRAADTWVVTVADDGPGVPAALRPRLFERFVRGDRTQREGAGLGLALAAAVVVAHGGTLRLDEGTPRGARFVVTLPVAAPAR